MRRSGERVRFPTSGLPVAKARGRESVDGHIDEPFDARVFHDVLLTRFGFENDVERKRL